MKQRATSLPYPDRKITSNPSEQHQKHQDSNHTPNKRHNQSTTNNKNFLAIDSVIKQDLRGNNKILVRRNKQKFQTSSPAIQSNMRKTMNNFSNRYQAPQINRSSNFTLPQSEKQKFIDILQSKIIKSQHEEIFRENEKNDETNKVEMKIESVRYNEQPSNTYRINKINQSVEENRESHHISTDNRLKIKSHRGERIQRHMPTIRSRSRTIARDQNQIKQSPKNKDNQISRTIELHPQQQRTKINKSLKQIERYEKNSHPKDTKDIYIQISKISEQKQDHNHNNQMARNRESQNLQLSSVNINNTQTYENEVNVLTKDFFQQWQRMNANKSKIYKNLRNKLVNIFPNMKKHYKEFRQSTQFLDANRSTQEYNKNNKRQSVEQIIIFTNDLHSDLKTDKLLQGSSNLSASNAIQVKDFQQKMQQFHQRQQLKDIFKQAYFWSRTKNKSMSTSLLNEQEMQKREMVQLKKIQKNLTFMNYMKSKNNKSQILHSRNKIKGANIIKNKDSILQIQKQGTRQQQFLKKCLDNAIQNCIREYQ